MRAELGPEGSRCWQSSEVFQGMQEAGQPWPGGTEAGVSASNVTPRPSPQDYVNRFKFQSITADDTLGFFLEYFPELKEKGVDTIPGQHAAPLARAPG